MGETAELLLFLKIITQLQPHLVVWFPNTLKQTCWGSTHQRHLRSKIWWLVEFCNSHCVSHFAAFFIVMRTKISVVEYFLFFVYFSKLDWFYLGKKLLNEEAVIKLTFFKTIIRTKMKVCDLCKWSIRRFTYEYLVTTFSSSKWSGLLNFLDLRQVQKAHHKHSIGRSDGRCVQKAGT